MPDATPLECLEGWYLSQCDGGWEHENEIEIRSLDNPGWWIRIPLSGTNLQARPFGRLEVERSDDDWVRAWLEDDSWCAAAGPLNLTEALNAFLAWAESR